MFLIPPSVLPSLPRAQHAPAGTSAPLSGPRSPHPEGLQGQLAAFSATAVTAYGSWHCPRPARAGRGCPAWCTPFLLAAKPVGWLGATERRWPPSEAWLTLALHRDRRAAFSHSHNFMFANTEVSADSGAPRSALGFGPKLREGSKKGWQQRGESLPPLSGWFSSQSAARWLLLDERRTDGS